MALVLVVALTLTAVPRCARAWHPLAADAIHDPQGQGIPYLQEPAEALYGLPRATGGDRVDWARALAEKLVSPRTGLLTNREMKVLSLDVIMTRTGTMAHVRFSHRRHTEWLECSNCHDEIFKAKAGANPGGMLPVVLGLSCGQCHGAVAFPIGECRRCHSVPRR